MGQVEYEIGVPVGIVFHLRAANSRRCGPVTPLTQSQACGLRPFFLRPQCIQKKEEPEILPLPMAASLLAPLRTGDKKRDQKTRQLDVQGNVWFRSLHWALMRDIGGPVGHRVAPVKLMQKSCLRSRWVRPSLFIYTETWAWKNVREAGGSQREKFSEAIMDVYSQ